MTKSKSKREKRAKEIADFIRSFWAIPFDSCDEKMKFERYIRESIQSAYNEGRKEERERCMRIVRQYYFHHIGQTIGELIGKKRKEKVIKEK